MPVKSILEIDVNDEAFQTFLATFDKYKAAVDELPGAWAKVRKAASKTEPSFSRYGRRCYGTGADMS